MSISPAKEKVEIREFFNSLVVTYKSGSVVTYQLHHLLQRYHFIPSAFLQGENR